MHYIEYIDKFATLNCLCEIADSRGLNVNNLLEGFVDKGNFSKIKKGTTKKVSLDLLMYLANKLGENIEDIFRETSPSNPDFFEAIESIRYYTQIHDFAACAYVTKLVEEEYEEDMLKGIDAYQIFMICKAVIQMEANKDFYTALEILKEALDTNQKSFSFDVFDVNIYTEIELGIISSILICYFNINKQDTRLKPIFEAMIEFIETKHTDDYEIAFNIYYEYMLISGSIDYNPNELLDIALDTAQLALDNGITNKLPFIYCQIALIYTDLGDKENMEEYYSTAIFLYKQIGVPEAYLSKIIANREECRKMLEHPEEYK